MQMSTKLKLAKYLVVGLLAGCFFALLASIYYDSVQRIGLPICFSVVILAWVGKRLNSLERGR